MYKKTQRAALLLLCSIQFWSPLTVRADSASTEDSDTSSSGSLGGGDFVVEGLSSDGEEGGYETESATFWDEYIREPARITLAQEFSYKIEEPRNTIKNRSSVRLEYSKYFVKNFFLKFDGKSTAFLKRDHRHEPEGSDTRLTQAYLQTSVKQTSFTVGVQTVAWGESILAPITDEVSPRDNRELFNFNLSELRIGQPMLGVDQYSEIGHWSVFYIPEPSFNEAPEEGTAYYFDPLGEGVEIRTGIDGVDGGDDSEYGMRWKETFGSTDIAFMAAKLIDNEYALRMDEPGLITRKEDRFTMTGMTFNHAVSEFLFKAEVGFKSSKTFNDMSFQVLEKDTVDLYLGVEYAPSSSFSMSFSGVNQHISGWNNQIQGMPRDRQSYLFSITKLLMNDDLSLEFLGIQNRPYTSYINMLMTSYKVNDNLELDLNLIYPGSNDERSFLWNFRNQKQIGFKVQYQF